MTCKYKVKIKDIQYNYKVQMTDIQSKYKFKVFCTGYDDSEIKDKIDTMYEAWPKASGEGETITLNDTANTTMAIDLKGNTSQEGTPTPETPQDIHVVSGDNSIEVCGKNLFDKDTLISGYYLNTSGNLEANANYAVSQFINVIPGEQYYIPVRGTTRTKYYLKDKTAYSNTWDVSDVAQVITIPNNVYFIRITVAIAGSTQIDVNSFQLEKGNQATTYQEYKGASYPINLGDIELCKIGDYQDSIVKDNGKWYLHKEIGKITYNGTEPFGYTNSGVSGIKMITKMLNDMATGNYLNGFSNYFKNNMGGKNANTIRLGANDKSFYIYVNESDFASLDAWKTWLTTHNTNIYYLLATPTYTEITDSTLLSQLEALKQAESYSGQTNISQVNNDKPFIITAKALKDLSNL